MSIWICSSMLSTILDVISGEDDLWAPNVTTNFYWIKTQVYKRDPHFLVSFLTPTIYLPISSLDDNWSFHSITKPTLLQSSVPRLHLNIHILILLSYYFIKSWCDVLSHPDSYIYSTSLEKALKLTGFTLKWCA